MKVLLVEDDASLREGMGDVLAELAEVRAAGSVDAALAALREDRFELVLTDLRITGKAQGGRTILEAARRRLQPVVIVSAAQEEEIRQALQPLQADAILAKPFQLEDMVALVERFLMLRGDMERLAKQRPVESGWAEVAAGVHVLQLAEAQPGQALTWIRMQPGASCPWPLSPLRAGVLLVEGDLQVEGEHPQAPHYLFLSMRQPPTSRTEQGCLAVSLALRGG
ncbi:MAG: response regulator [Myxococcaceae bacterium]|nr:response regulator [Myxococcaceae bacterium]